jgi:nitroreductase
MSVPASEPSRATTHQLLATRWSPRSYNPAHELDEQTLSRILEAARWAPSAANSQPWRFLLARRGTAEHAALFGTLADGNKLWAGDASVLILVAAQTATADGNPMPYGDYDTGQAVAHLSTQAHHEGLWTHQMGGFDRAAAAEVLGLPDGVAPLVVVAVGERADAERLPDALAEREIAPRTRLPLDQLVLRPATELAGASA